MSKINIPKHIDFQPRKDLNHFFERKSERYEREIIEFPEMLICPECGKNMFADQEICGWCYDDFLKNDKRKKITKFNKMDTA